MLSIEEIKNVKFHKAGKNAYNVDDVEAFIEDVIATVEQLNAEKNELVRKMGILAKKIEQYREDEETVRNALITSQKLSDNTLKEANDKASYIIKTAEKKSRAILTEAEMATEREKDKFESLHAETAKLRKEIIALYKKHLAVVEELPTEEDVKAKREELDQKYPFEPIENVVPEEAADVEEEMVKTTEPEVKPQPAAVEEPTVRVELKHDNSQKFQGLQFGDNYDVE